MIFTFIFYLLAHKTAPSGLFALSPFTAGVSHGA